MARSRRSFFRIRMQDTLHTDGRYKQWTLVLGPEQLNVDIARGDVNEEARPKTVPTEGFTVRCPESR